MDNDITPEAEGLSRRDMLKRSALVGGTVVWMAPAVQTLATPAFASGSPVNENPCIYTAFVKYDIGGGFSDTEGIGNENCRISQCAIANVAVSPTGVLTSGGQTIGQVTASYVAATDCLTLDFAWTNTSCGIDESSSYWVFKDGGGAGCEGDDSGVLSTVTTNASGDTYVICGSGLGGNVGGGTLSHVNLCVCVRC